MKNLIYLSTLLLSIFPLTAHAAFEKILISSTPSAASLFINNACIGKTPMIVELNTKETYQIFASKEGHVPMHIPLASSSKKQLLYLVIPGGALLFAIDCMRGKSSAFSTSHLHLDLPQLPLSQTFRSTLLWSDTLNSA